MPDLTRSVPADDAVVVRRARPDDAPAVWPLVGQLATSFRPEREAFDATFREVLARDDMLLAVADRSGDVVGYLLVGRHATLFANDPVAWVEELLVRPERRRQGIGRSLVVAAEHWAQEQGVAYVALATRRAEDFYTRLGYERSATFYRKLVPRD